MTFWDNSFSFLVKVKGKKPELKVPTLGFNSDWKPLLSQLFRH